MQGQLVDDMAIGKRVHEAGYKNVMSRAPLHIATGGMTLRQFLPVFRRWMSFSRNGLPLSFVWRQWLQGAEFFVALWPLVAALVRRHFSRRSCRCGVAAMSGQPARAATVATAARRFRPRFCLGGVRVLLHFAGRARPEHAQAQGRVARPDLRARRLGRARRGGVDRSCVPSSAGVRIGVRLQTRNATASFLLLFGLTLGYSILEAARDALFLARFPATRLPIAYLGIALAVIIVHILFPARRSGPGSGRRLFVELVLAALALLAFAGLHARAPRRLDVPLLYVLVGVLGTMLMVRVWVLVGGAFDIGQARRSFARIAAGGLVGSISGAGFAAYQLRHAPAESLLPIAAVVWLATALVPLGLQLPAAAARPHGDRAARGVARADVPRPLCVAALLDITLATVVATVGDFLFKAANAADTTPAAVGAVLARFQLAVNAGAFLVQLVVAPTLLRRAGANRTIWRSRR